jgi:hypothetical protein
MLTTILGGLAAHDDALILMLLISWMAIVYITEKTFKQFIPFVRKKINEL